MFKQSWQLIIHSQLKIFPISVQVCDKVSHLIVHKLLSMHQKDDLSQYFKFNSSDILILDTKIHLIT